MIAQIILNIQKHDPMMLGNWCDEMGTYFEDLLELKSSSGTAKAYTEVLNSIRDAARALNFRNFESRIFDLKRQIVNESISDELSPSQSIWNEISKIKSEWVRLRACVLAVKKVKQDNEYITQGKEGV